MLQVTNCFYTQGNQVLMLNKPRRGWWFAPGGKMEDGESISDACCREFLEETGLTITKPTLSSVFTVVIKQADQVVEEWMLYSFTISDATGEELSENHEGKLRWIKLSEINELLMAEGDKIILDHILHGSGVLIGKVTYTEDYDLIDIHYSSEH